jgi:hypothetical protein
MVSSGLLRRVALVGTDVSGELGTSFIRLTRIGELGTTLAVTNKEPHGVTAQKTPFNQLNLFSKIFAVYFGKLTKHVCIRTQPWKCEDLFNAIESGTHGYHRKTHEHNMVSKLAKQKQTPWPLVRKRTIPTERPPLVDEI